MAGAPLSPVGPGLGPLWGGGVPAAEAGWGRAADVHEGGAQLFSRPRAFSWRFRASEGASERASAALGLEGPLLGTRCEQLTVGPNSLPARAGLQVAFCFPPRCRRAAAMGNAAPPELTLFLGSERRRVRGAHGECGQCTEARPGSAVGVQGRPGTLSGMPW